MIVERRSIVRRPSAGVALLGLAVLSVGLTAVARCDVLAASAVASVGCLAMVRRSWSAPWRENRGVLTLVALAALVEGLSSDWATAAALWLRLTALVCAAQIVTASWSWSEITAALVAFLRPFDRLRLLDAERCAFTLMLAIRFVPVMLAEIAEIREAQALRGLDRSVYALAVPLGVRILSRADEIAEAVDLRVCPVRRRIARSASTVVAQSLPPRSTPTSGSSS
jgi:biotin transport system permease protein